MEFIIFLSDGIPTIMKQITEQDFLEDLTFLDPEEVDLQLGLYRKKEMYIGKTNVRDKISPDEKLAAYKKICLSSGGVKLKPTQLMLANYINPTTPYPGVVVFYGTGVGKTIASIAVGEQFVPNVERFGTRVHVIVPSSLLASNYRSEIIKITGEKYRIPGSEKYNVEKVYNILVEKTFSNLVLEDDRSGTARKITNLDNSVLIVDEAHNFTDGNKAYQALRKVVDQSYNLKVVLLTATPARNYADSILDLFNFIRPKQHPILHGKVFSGTKGSLTFCEGGEKYFRKMIQGYVSYLRGADPLTFAEEEEKGERLEGMRLVKVIPCTMSPIQEQVYRRVIEEGDLSFQRKPSGACNIVFPNSASDGNQVEMVHSKSGVLDLVVQLQSDPEKLNDIIFNSYQKLTGEMPPVKKFFWLTKDKKLTGNFFRSHILKFFSCKMYAMLEVLNRGVIGDLGPGLRFVYMELLQAGIDIVEEVISMDGYLKYKKNPSNYKITQNTRCYLCGKRKKNHQSADHQFGPAVFLSVTGKAEESAEYSETKHNIIKNVVGSPDNVDGKYIKVVLGSAVMREGVNLPNCRGILILESPFSIGLINQVKGRGIRYCTSTQIILNGNLYPKVNLWKFVAVLPKKPGEKHEPTSDEILYQKAEKKYVMIQKIERIMKEEAFDCPLNLGLNTFREEMEKYANCIPPGDDGQIDGGIECPANCGYQSCQLICSSKQLNEEYYCPDRAIYRKLTKEELDYTTYSITLAQQEIDDAKDKIAELFLENHAYQIDEIIRGVMKKYPEDKKVLFDEYYVYQALSSLIPTSESDFNTFGNIIRDKYGRKGYLLHVDKYYVFHPNGEPETLPMHYRKNYIPQLGYPNSLGDHLRQDGNLKKYENDTSKRRGTKSKLTTYQYHDNSATDPAEADFIAIIDSKGAVRSQDSFREGDDEFKVRIARPAEITSKRMTGVPTLVGSVCVTKSKKFLSEMANYLGVSIDGRLKREPLCKEIEVRCTLLEKYGRDKNAKLVGKLKPVERSGKLVNRYLLVPINHPTLPYPFNLHDRTKALLQVLQEGARKEEIDTWMKSVSINVEELAKNPTFPDLYIRKITFQWPSHYLEGTRLQKYIQKFELVKTKDGYSME